MKTGIKRKNILLLFVVIAVGIVGVYLFSQKGIYGISGKPISKCPENYCRDWIYGSCSNKQVIMERECYKYPPIGTPEECENNKEIYYETKTQNVEACSQQDCPSGTTFIKDEMRCEVVEKAATTCPEDYCLDWIYGSCSNNQQYMERECHKFYGPDCKENIYYESKIVEVEECP